MAKGNETPLWKSYLFPAYGLLFDITILCVKGFPSLLWSLLALASFAVGCIWIYTNWEADGETTMQTPMVLATVGPLLSLILGLAN